MVLLEKIEEERNLFFVGKKDKNNTIIYIIMSFTEKSENLIKGFVKEFENYCVKKSQSTQNRTDNIYQLN